MVINHIGNIGVEGLNQAIDERVTGAGVFKEKLNANYARRNTMFQSIELTRQSSVHPSAEPLLTEVQTILIGKVDEMLTDRDTFTLCLQKNTH